jgi:hypothetical protein
LPEALAADSHRGQRSAAVGRGWSDDTTARNNIRAVMSTGALTIQMSAMNAISISSANAAIVSTAVTVTPRNHYAASCTLGMLKDDDLYATLEN